MNRFCVTFAFFAVGLFPATSKGADILTNVIPPKAEAAWQWNLANLQNPEGRQRLHSCLSQIRSIGGDVASHVHERGKVEGIQALSADVKRVETGRVSRCAMFDPRTGDLRRFEFRAFEDESRKRADHGQSYDIDFVEGMPVLFRQRDGKETLAFYPSGSLKTYLSNIDADRWYIVQWDERGAVVSEKIGRNTRVIGTVQVDK